MNICNSQIEDIDRIFELYEIATNFQNKKSMVAWPKFKRELVQKEISVLIARKQKENGCQTQPFGRYRILLILWTKG